MSYSSTMDLATRTLHGEGVRDKRAPSLLLDRYSALIGDLRLSWTGHLRLLKQLGIGGQGRVYLSERRGADHFTLPVAVKIFSPEHYMDDATYEEAMARIARVSALVGQIQQDNLLDVQDFIDRDRVRIMVMEWIDGYDLSQLLVPEMLTRIRDRADKKRWEYLNRVIVTNGPVHPQLKPGVAVAIVRDCLAALAALHREGIVHGDVKPSNIMLKVTGNAKIIDIGSAVELADPPPQRTVTPTYAAPEVLDGGDVSPRSDLASLGYVLIEMLSGRPLFPGQLTLAQLIEQKRGLPQRLPTILPQEVTHSDLLMSFCRGLIAPDPMRRFRTAEEADLVQQGAAAFQRQLVLGNLSSEYENEIRTWIRELKEADEPKI